jgi:endonuclease G
MPNEASKEPLQHFAVTIDSVESLTGLDLFYRLPKAVQRTLESHIDTKQWSWTLTATRAVKE